MNSMIDDRSTAYKILAYILEVVEKSDDFKQIIETFFETCSQRYQLDAIVVKEFTSDNSVRCTYEWCKDNNYELLNIEARGDVNIRLKCDEFFRNNNGYYAYNKNDDESLNDIRLIHRGDLLGSCIEFPIYQNDVLVGAFDFVDSVNCSRDWEERIIAEVYEIIDYISSFIFPIRELEENSRMISSDYDSITYLPKYEKFVSEVEKVRKSHTNLGFVSVDFSNFKYLNDKYGYKAGNEVLVTIARLIYSCSNRIVSCCRLYSDHYIVAFKQVSSKAFSIIRDLSEMISKRTIAILQEKFFDVNIILNIGVYFMKPSDKKINIAIDNASIARKFAKQSKAVGNFRLMQYNINMSLAVSRQADFIATMQKGIADNEFFIQLQPKCMTDTFNIVGAEALVRWRKNYDVINPNDFIPTFEANGCIVRLDYFVYEKVFEYIRKRMDENKTVVPISVNVSHIHFDNTELLDFIKGLLEKYDINPANVEFEFTEKIYITENINVDVVINGLKELGFKIYLDDFGAGYSSLNTLMKYSIDGIKLDRRFMKNRLEHKDKVIISGVVNLANKLNLDVICEGVENEEQRAFLLKNECPYIQGFYFSPPINIEQFDYLLDNG